MNDCPYCRDGIPRTEYGVHVVSEFEIELCTDNEPKDKIENDTDKPRKKGLTK